MNLSAGGRRISLPIALPVLKLDSYPGARLLIGTPTDNNNSLVLRYGRFSLLLTGDLEWGAKPASCARRISTCRGPCSR